MEARAVEARVAVARVAEAAASAGASAAGSSRSFPHEIRWSQFLSQTHLKVRSGYGDRVRAFVRGGATEASMVKEYRSLFRTYQWKSTARVGRTAVFSYTPWYVLLTYGLWYGI